ncbi:glucosaminidase domain-containing protein [Bacteroidales bacterium OttesenSCG-928-I14]|nr:glucosaminidase domain-containing protein [Bacteroidales bacterium OttesenSCG-928-I14]
MKMQRNISLLLLLLLFVPIQFISAQKRLKHYDEYIDAYSQLAVKHMKKYGIPASITLAQGILESGAGKSELAKESNNHFGIKCHSDWQGDRVFRNDDGPNDCFRKYKKVDDSFDDHSRFIAERARYQKLFSYDITDYEAWARGLQSCNYATDKKYANKLITLIEDYELYLFDGGSKKQKKESSKPASKAKKNAVTTKTAPVEAPAETVPTNKKPSVINEKKTTEERRKKIRFLHTFGSLFYVIAEENDSMEAIAMDTDVTLKKLLSFNDVSTDYIPQEGEIIYLQKKKAKADKPHFDHEVKAGESMHSISQFYGMQKEQLYKLNKKSHDYIPKEGDILILR